MKGAGGLGKNASKLESSFVGTNGGGGVEDSFSWAGEKLGALEIIDDVGVSGVDEDVEVGMFLHLFWNIWIDC